MMKKMLVVNRITKKESPAFKQYLSDISNIPMFTKKEELECCIKMANGDRKAKEELIKRNLRFVVSMAKQYETSDISIEDLVNEGNIGLVLAADRYKLDDHELDESHKFITYAVFWIRKMFLEFIYNSKLIRMPCNKVAAMSKFNKKVNELEQLHGRAVDANEALDELRGVLPPNEIQNFEKYLTLRVDSLDKTFMHGDNETSLHELIIDDSLDAPDFELGEQDTKRELNTLLGVLKKRDKKIMEDLYGLNGKVPMTLEQVSEQVGLTREMVRQIKEKSLKTLKKQLCKT